MQCGDIQRDVDSFIDGELADPERREFESHLHECPVCQSLCSDQRRFKSELRRTLQPVAVPAQLRQRIDQAVTLVAGYGSQSVVDGNKEVYDWLRNGVPVDRVESDGRRTIERARVILAEATNIRALAANLRHETQGELRIATTHTQARFVLPRAIAALKRRYPQVSVHL